MLVNIAGPSLLGVGREFSKSKIFVALLGPGRRLGARIAYSSTVDHMKISKTMVSGGKGPLFLPTSAYRYGSFWVLFAKRSSTINLGSAQKRGPSAQTPLE